MDVTKEVLDLFWDRVDGEVVIWIRDRYNSDSDFKKIIDAITTSKESKPIDNFAYLLIKCEYCKQESMMADYHHSFKMQAIKQDGTIDPGVYYIHCPKCDEKNVLNLSIEKEGGNASG